jgi:hypothetical protein
MIDGFLRSARNAQLFKLGYAGRSQVASRLQLLLDLGAFLR